MKLTESLLKQLWYLAIDSSLEVFAQNKAPTLLAAQPEAPELGEALRELVRLKDLKDRLETSLSYVGRGIDEQEYALAKPKAWEAARAALAQKAVPVATKPTNFIARAIAQEERACRAEDVLIDLVNQIRKSSPVDDHGHNLKMNMAFVKAVEFLDAAQTDAAMGAPQAIQRIMTRLADILDEDQFAEIEQIATSAGIEPPVSIASPEEAVPAAWRPGSEIPPVKVDDHAEFIVAVRRSHAPDKVFVFSSNYANQYTGDDSLLDRDGNPSPAHGWYQVGLDLSGEFDQVYEKALSDGDEVLGWQPLPKWSHADWPATHPAAAQPSRAEVLEEACVAIKAADDLAADDDYMLDSDDCIRAIRALKDKP